ncbi:phosphatase PAP2 family protein [Streptomyces sp. NPDC000410]|uniref:phosphatase PAP2 family protein n=1 Tax=Streptomyces sp. NPDC000410 TaxID=3154254 RepID=UPI00331B0796
MSTDIYLDVTDFARNTPHWVQQLAELWTEAGLLVFGVLFVVAWWRARADSTRALATAVLAPLATAAAYVCSESLKSLVDEERPCRAVASAVASLVPCPPTGDWSFPSNHATIAGAAAVALVLVRPGSRPGRGPAPGGGRGPGPGRGRGPAPRRERGTGPGPGPRPGLDPGRGSRGSPCPWRC